MTNKVRFCRNESGQMKVQVDEGTGWVSFKQSKLPITSSHDPNNCGMDVFRAAIKAGYSVEEAKEY